ncbi:unnamed protein product [Symbiodinium natans]|uniref:Uncharacterized protein n=1 Tax=Symbiodinium natans TaxID=878477 RepID=A0A812RJL6_9DINO|nr:unnamed protein product [Symbiodinium natans]
MVWLPETDSAASARGRDPAAAEPQVCTRPTAYSTGTPGDGELANTEFQGLVPAPHDSEDDADVALKPDIASLAGPGGRSQVCCPAGKASRPDTCFMTHRYVKQEIAYLARRIDEVGRYFLALESMLGSGALGPVLDRSLKELEKHLQHPEKLQEPEEVQGYIDAAVRLGIGPERYRPLQDRYSWLCHGRHQEDLRMQLTEAAMAEDSMQLQQLIDDSLRAGIGAEELHPARVRLQALHAREFNEGMLSAAASGDTCAVREKLRTGGDSDAQQQSTGFSLWHIAASRGDAKLAGVARSCNASVELLDRSGWTALMLASAQLDCVLVQALLAAEADLTARSDQGEVIVDCQTKEELEALKKQLSNGRLAKHWSDSGRCLDFGDELVAGEELMLPTFQTVGGRTALHCALLRPGEESSRVSVINELTAQVQAPVNALDDLGYSPLWYAACSGYLGSVSALLRAGATVSLGSCSCLQAAAGAFAKAVAESAPAEASLQICRVLLRHGAGDFVEELLDAEAAIARAGVSLALEHIPEFEEALEGSGSAAALEAGCAEASQVLEARYNSSLLVHRPPSQLASAKDAAAFATAAQPDFETIAFALAKSFGGYADVPRDVSVSHMMRLARLQRRYAGDFCYTSGAAIDWAAVVGGLEATLVFQSIPDVYKALAELDRTCSCKIRGIWDHLLRRDSAQPSWQEFKSVERAEADAVVEGEQPRASFRQDPATARQIASAGVEAAARKALSGLAEERSAAQTVAKASVEAATKKALQSVCGMEAATVHQDRASAAAVAAASISAATQKALDTLAAEGSHESPAAAPSLPIEDRASAVAVAAASISAAAQKALDTLAAEGSREASLDQNLVSRQLRESQASRSDTDMAEVQVMIECSGAVCLLRLTAAGVHEAAQATVDAGRWVLEELASVMRAAVEGMCSPLEAEEEAHEILEAAARRLGHQKLTQVLATPMHDASNSWTCTASGLAAHCGLVEVLKLLVDAGAPVSQPRLPTSLAPRGDCSPLSLAVAGHHFPCIAQLLASGADPFDDRVDALLLDMLSDDWLEARWFQEKVLRILEVSRSQSQVDARTLAKLGASFDGSPGQDIIHGSLCSRNQSIAQGDKN